MPEEFFDSQSYCSGQFASVGATHENVHDAKCPGCGKRNPAFQSKRPPKFTGVPAPHEVFTLSDDESPLKRHLSPKQEPVSRQGRQNVYMTQNQTHTSSSPSPGPSGRRIPARPAPAAAQQILSPVIPVKIRQGAAEVNRREVNTQIRAQDPPRRDYSKLPGSLIVSVMGYRLKDSSKSSWKPHGDWEGAVSSLLTLVSNIERTYSEIRDLLLERMREHAIRKREIRFWEGKNEEWDIVLHALKPPHTTPTRIPRFSEPIHLSTMLQRYKFPKVVNEKGINEKGIQDKEYKITLCYISETDPFEDSDDFDRDISPSPVRKQKDKPINRQKDRSVGDESPKRKTKGKQKTGGQLDEVKQEDLKQEKLPAIKVKKEPLSRKSKDEPSTPNMKRDKGKGKAKPIETQQTGVDIRSESGPSVPRKSLKRPLSNSHTTSFHMSTRARVRPEAPLTPPTVDEEGVEQPMTLSESMRDFENQCLIDEGELHQEENEALLSSTDNNIDEEYD